MNTCPEYAALLDLYVDGELSAEEMAQVAAHIANCPDCASYVDDALAIRAAFPDVEDTPVPEDFSRRVMEAVAAHPRTAPSKKRRIWLRAAFPLAACLAVVAVLQSGTLQHLIPAGTGSSGSDSAAYNVTASAGMAMADSGDSPADNGASAEESATLPRVSNDTGDVVEEEPAADRIFEESASDESTSDGAAPEPQESVPEDAPAAEKDAAAPQLFTAEAAAVPDLTLTAQEAGTLLEGYTPVSETEAQRLYQLTASEYAAFVEALDAQGVVWSGPAPETAEIFLVALTL